MELHINLDLCQGHGKCYMSAPALFEPDDDDEWGRARIIAPEFDAADSRTRTAAEQAVAGCPERALTITN